MNDFLEIIFCKLTRIFFIQELMQLFNIGGKRTNYDAKSSEKKNFKCLTSQ